MQLQWTEPAARDLDEVEKYISRENSPVVAIDIVIEGAPYVIIYRQVGPDQLQVIRVLHDAPEAD